MLWVFVVTANGPSLTVPLALRWHFALALSDRIIYPPPCPLLRLFASPFPPPFALQLDAEVAAAFDNIGFWTINRITTVSRDLE